MTTQLICLGWGAGRREIVGVGIQLYSDELRDVVMSYRTV